MMDTTPSMPSYLQGYFPELEDASDIATAIGNQNQEEVAATEYMSSLIVVTAEALLPVTDDEEQKDRVVDKFNQRYNEATQ